MRLEIGMLIRTNYSGPYRIIDIRRGCTCSAYLDELDQDDPPKGPPHIHLELTGPDGKGRFYLNRWDEENLQSLDKSYCGFKATLDYDKIFILEQDRPVQGSLF